MTAEAQARRPTRGKAAIYFLIASLLALVIIANWHLVHVAMTSQPDCVAHVRQDARKVAAGGFSAAQSACTPP